MSGIDTQYRSDISWSALVLVHQTLECGWFDRYNITTFSVTNLVHKLTLYNTFRPGRQWDSLFNSHHHISDRMSNTSWAA